jgi:hypothetical protein
MVLGAQTKPDSNANLVILGRPSGTIGPKAVFLRGGREVYQVPCHALGPYVEAWKGFAGERSGELVSISELGLKPLIKVPNLYQSVAFAVSPDGTNIAELLEASEELKFIRLKDLKILWKIKPSDLARMGVPVRSSEIPDYSIVFSQDGTQLAVSLASDGKPDMTNMRPACTVVFDARTGHATYEGIGNPVVFLHNKILKMDFDLNGGLLGRIGHIPVAEGYAWAVSPKGVWTIPRAKKLKPLVWRSLDFKSSAVIAADLNLDPKFIIRAVQAGW